MDFINKHVGFVQCIWLVCIIISTIISIIINIISMISG
jgi:hypothetical protein